ncbi:unnamed protein product [Ascophyllum nodosum]
MSTDFSLNLTCTRDRTAGPVSRETKSSGSNGEKDITVFCSADHQ